MAEYRLLQRGDPAPWFRQRSSNSESFSFDTAAGRYIVLCFYASASDEQGRQMLSLTSEERALFDDDKIAFFGVSVDPADEKDARVKPLHPGVRFFWDFDGVIAKAYGALPVDATGPRGVRRFWAVLDPTMRIMSVFDALRDGSERREVASFLKALPSVDSFPGFQVNAPILVLPDVFEDEICQNLIGLYERHGGTESGFMREVNGRTVAVTDYKHKRRADYIIRDKDLIGELQKRVVRRVVPEVRKVHQFVATRMERYIVSCYDSRDGGHFRAHRDNTTRGTAHRRFAVSINLNADFDGGEIGFPEYGSKTLKPPPGGAVVFSCSLLHAVTPVTAGRRFAFLPFLYDDEAAALRERNNAFLGDGIGEYRNRS